ncbi:MAG TPA: hypothetical protein VEG64_16935 [Candidatus Sulfotelmatobacter sp.]|nr:hypothetical protein [Candidatus Sulfotelmatobacter sp.]
MQYQGTGEYFLVFNELVKAAQHRGTVTYQELAHLIGLPIIGDHMANELGQCLGAISRAQNDSRRPMLTAVAVTVNGLPGDGFFKLAKELNKYSGSEDREQRRVFWESEVRLVYDLWQRKF